MKKPTSGSSSARLRFADGVPIASCSWSVQRWSRAAHPASSVMNSVAPHAWPMARARAVVSGSSAARTAPPRCVSTAGRGWSVGSSSRGRSRSCAVQKASCAAASALFRQLSCQVAKSAYCSGIAGSAAAAPPAVAA
jgi:hypothetical protein